MHEAREMTSSKMSVDKFYLDTQTIIKVSNKISAQLSTRRLAIFYSQLAELTPSLIQSICRSLRRRFLQEHIIFACLLNYCLV